MIRVDETDPVGEIEPSFPYRDVAVRRGVEFKDCYNIQSEIGRGKFGTVYRCTDKSNGLTLAAKVVNTLKKEDRRAVEREVEIMRRLQHPRLIQLYDAIDTGRQFYVILELIEGGELFERVIDDDFVLTERSCGVFMRQICEGVEFIHAQKILHLDLKPENILCLTKEGNRIKIIDFGLAREYDPKKKLQVLFGTPEFVAPEVVNFDQIGFGTDMWSIGVICYVLLSGLSPFMGDTDLETMANVTIAKYDFDHDAFTEISDDAKDFIRCLLIKEKDKRMTAAQCRDHRWLVQKEGKQQAQQQQQQQQQQLIREVQPKVKNNVEIRTTSEIKENPREELDVTKDNLRLFVERWREHPDSPYMLEVPQTCTSKPGTVWDPEEMVSIRAQSPSPRGSISSSLSGTTTSSLKESQGFLLSVPSFSLGLERRASEGTTLEKSRPDTASQIMLADEIIKLSEHLRSIAMGTRIDPLSEDKSQSSQDNLNKSATEKQTITERSKSSTNGIHTKSNGIISSESSECNEITEKLSSITRHRKLNGTTFHSNRSFEKYTETNSGNTFASLRKAKFASGKSGLKIDNESTSQEDATNSKSSESFETGAECSRTISGNANRLLSIEKEMDLTPPWRRPRVKHFFGETSRDVPRIVNLRDLHKDLNLDEPTSTKNLLLRLLEEWEDVPARPSGVGRKSVSVDWYGEESVARKTINSLAEYFQSKQQQSTSTVSQNDSPSIHR